MRFDRLTRNMADSVLSVVGAAFLAYHGLNFGLQVLQGIRTFILPSLGFKKNFKRSFGSWAVVTGCTDGIGKSYVKQLAKQGINIVLISRNMEKLKNVDQEIRSLYNVNTKIIVMDFSGGPEIYEGLEEKLKDLEIGILVNNVGVGDSCPDFFLMSSVQDDLKMLNVNVLSVVMMMHIILPGMVSRKKGLVINVSSVAGSMPMPLIATYSATKAFVDFFSRSLNTEYSSKGITVQCVMPMFVSTNMTKNMPTSALVPTGDNFVNQALGTVGVEPRTCGYWSHSLQAWVFYNILPGWLRSYIIWKIWYGIRTMVYKRRRRQEEQQKSGHND
ncbi:very-long-chain 3-oxoacyl-CoA reductase-B-like [Actinia tenebrosa]|uniref:Very-long-chain 3-oxoacyl-CoA reductase-B-like n=1 Tax=Actinia tenebrosa TaxID=6105 RepID=A0A6P8IM07_ACTTE|nr:very-long-chain 3-oxoacyl-CoA reductase-B-like [Actinia tenebrosa]